MPCRTYEPFEVVGLIFHQPELVEACSEEALLQALKGLLQVLSITRNKVYSCLPAQVAFLPTLDQYCKLLTPFWSHILMCSFTSGLVLSVLIALVQHAAKHALWAMSQQALPAAVLQPEIASCLALLLRHLQLPLSQHSSSAASRCAWPRKHSPAWQSNPVKPCALLRLPRTPLVGATASN